MKKYRVGDLKHNELVVKVSDIKKRIKQLERLHSDKRRPSRCYVCKVIAELRRMI